MTNYEIRYVSSSGKVVNLSEGAYYADGTSLPSWEIELVTLNSRVAGIRRGMPEYEFTVAVVSSDEEAATAARNALYEVPAADVETNSPGRLYMNDWYLTGFMTASKPNYYWNERGVAHYELKFVATEARWVRESDKPFVPKADTDFLDYPHDYSYDFASSSSADTVENPNYAPSTVRIDVQGPAVDPSITIGGNRYKVNVELEAGERLVIDGKQKTVEVVSVTGERTNVFSKRDGIQVVGSGEYVFEPVAPGVNSVIWEGSLTFALTLIEQRAEPRWS